MTVNAKIAVLAVSACFATPLAVARECSNPPVRTSEQAACYATVYAEKNKLAHARPLTRQVAKGTKVWTVRYADKRRNTRGAGWEVDVDAASGTITRFMGYKERQP
jgi:hypothetical protein